MREKIKRKNHIKEAASTLVSNSMERLDEFAINVRTGDEIEDLADTFGRMTRELSAYIVNLSAVTAEKERIKRNLISTPPWIPQKRSAAIFTTFS